ncbi:Adenylate cyclase type 10 [Phlyctochytrium planicorne]|nr:Adenylate cyclase type 10 [Phlyctochytrium planicorne]
MAERDRFPGRRTSSLAGKNAGGSMVDLSQLSPSNQKISALSLMGAQKDATGRNRSLSTNMLNVGGLQPSTSSPTETSPTDVKNDHTKIDLGSTTAVTTSDLKAGLGTHLLAKKVYRDLVKQAQDSTGKDTSGLDPSNSEDESSQQSESIKSAESLLQMFFKPTSKLPGSYFEVEDGCAVAFIDISGYSRLTTELTTQYGSLGGATLIKGLINPIVEDIVKFCGDSVTVSWTPTNSKGFVIPKAASKTKSESSSEESKNTLLRAIACSLNLLEKFSNYSIHLPVATEAERASAEQQGNLGANPDKEKKRNSSQVGPVTHFGQIDSTATTGVSAPESEKPDKNIKKKGLILFNKPSWKNNDAMTDSAGPVASSHNSRHPSVSHASSFTTSGLPIAAGMQMDTMSGNVPVVKRKETKMETRSMKLHIGIGFGKVFHLHVGGRSKRLEYFLAGPAACQAASVLDDAKSGELALANEAWQVFADSAASRFPTLLNTLQTRKYDNSTIIEKFGKQSAIVMPILIALGSQKVDPQLAIGSRAATDKSSDRKGADALPSNWFDYLSESLAYQLSMGTGIGDHRELNEVRRVTAMFVRLTNLEHLNDSADDIFNVSQTLMEFAMSSVSNYGCSIRQMTFDEKGLTLILIWGLPPYTHELEGPFALRAAIEFQNSITKSHIKDLTYSISIATGTVFSGVVGGGARIDQTVMGAAINLAARLMVHPLARSAILVDNITRDEVQNENFLFSDPHFFKVKGMTADVRAHVLYGVNRQTGKAMVHKSKVTMIGREKEEGRLWELLDSWSNGEPTVIPIIGVSGMGKSLLISNVYRDVLESENLITCYADCVEVDHHISYSAANILLQNFCSSVLANKKLLTERLQPSSDDKETSLQKASPLLSTMLKPSPSNRSQSRRVSYAFALMPHSFNQSAVPHLTSIPGVTSMSTSLHQTGSASSSSSLSEASTNSSHHVGRSSVTNPGGPLAGLKKDESAGSIAFQKHYDELLAEHTKSFNEVEFNLKETIALLGESTIKLPLFNKVMNVKFPENSYSRNLTDDSLKHTFKALFAQMIEKVYKGGGMEIAIFIDSGQFLDSSSWELIRYITQRCPYVLVILGTRPLSEYPVAYKPYMEYIVDLAGDQALQLNGIDAEAAEKIILSHLDGLKVIKIEEKLISEIMLRSCGVPSICETVGTSLQGNHSAVIIKNAILFLADGVQLEDLLAGDSYSAYQRQYDKLQSRTWQVMLKYGSILGQRFTAEEFINIIRKDKRSLFREKESDEILQLLESSSAMKEYRLKNDTYNFIEVQGEMKDPTTLIYFTHIMMSKAIYNLIDPHIQAKLHRAAFEAYKELLNPSNEAIMLPKILNHLAKFPEATLNEKIYYTERCLNRFCALNMIPDAIQLNQTLVLLFNQKTDWQSMREQQITIGLSHGQLAMLLAIEFLPATMTHVFESLRLLCGYEHPKTPFKLIVRCLKTFFRSVKAVSRFVGRIHHDSGNILASSGQERSLEETARRERMRVFLVMSNYYLQRNQNLDGMLAPLNIILSVCEGGDKLPQWGAMSFYILASIYWMFGMRKRGLMIRERAMRFHALSFQLQRIHEVDNSTSFLTPDEEFSVSVYGLSLHLTMDPINLYEGMKFGIRMVQKAFERGNLFTYHAFTMTSSISLLCMTTGALAEVETIAFHMWKCAIQIQPCNTFSAVAAVSMIYSMVEQANIDLSSIWYRIAIDQMQILGALDGSVNDSFGAHFFGMKSVLKYQIYSSYHHFYNTFRKLTTVSKLVQPEFVVSLEENDAEQQEAESANTRKPVLKAVLLRKGLGLSKTSQIKKTAANQATSNSGAQTKIEAVEESLVEEVTSEALKKTCEVASRSVLSGIPTVLISSPALLDYFISGSRWMAYVEDAQFLLSSCDSKLDTSKLQRDWALERQSMKTLTEAAAKVTRANKGISLVFLICEAMFRSLELFLAGNCEGSVAILTDILKSPKWEKLLTDAKKELGIIKYDFDMLEHDNEERTHYVPQKIEGSPLNYLLTDYITGVICSRAAVFTCLYRKLEGKDLVGKGLLRRATTRKKNPNQVHPTPPSKQPPKASVTQKDDANGKKNKAALKEFPDDQLLKVLVDHARKYLENIPMEQQFLDYFVLGTSGPCN